MSDGVVHFDIYLLNMYAALGIYRFSTDTLELCILHTYEAIGTWNLQIFNCHFGIMYFGTLEFTDYAGLRKTFGRHKKTPTVPYIIHNWVLNITNTKILHQWHSLTQLHQSHKMLHQWSQLHQQWQLHQFDDLNNNSPIIATAAHDTPNIYFIVVT